MTANFEATIMLLGVRFGMLAFNENGYINHYINELFIMYKNGAGKIQLQYYINKYIKTL